MAKISKQNLSPKLKNIIDLKADRTVASPTENGLMSKEDKEKLDNITSLGLTEAEVQTIVSNNTGDKSLLLTDAKGDFVSSINELFTSANNGKSSIVTAVGLPSVESDTFATLAANITKGKIDIATAITNKGISASSTDTLEQFKTKIGNIQGGENATAVSGDILTGKTAVINKSLITGSMPNNGTRTFTPSTSNQTIPAGYHNGSGYVAGSSSLTAGNIRSGANIFGINGTYTGEGMKKIADARQGIIVSSSDYYSSKFDGWYGKSITVTGIPTEPWLFDFSIYGSMYLTNGGRVTGGAVGGALAGIVGGTTWLSYNDASSNTYNSINMHMDGLTYYGSGKYVSFMLWFGKGVELNRSINVDFRFFA